MMALGACKKDEPQVSQHSQEKVQMSGGASGFVATLNYSQHDIDSIAQIKGVEQAATAKGAMDYWLVFPPKLPIPPHLMPVNNIAQLSATDSSAEYSAHSVHAPKSVLVSLRKKMAGKQVVWIVQRVEEVASDEKMTPPQKP